MIPLTNRPLSCRFATTKQRWQCYSGRNYLNLAHGDSPTSALQALSDHWGCAGKSVTIQKANGDVEMVKTPNQRTLSERLSIKA